MRYERALIIHSLDDRGTLHKIQAITRISKGQHYAVGHLIPFYFFGNIPDSVITSHSCISEGLIDSIVADATRAQREDVEDVDILYLISALERNLHLETLYKKFDKAVQDFSPDILLIHSGMVFRHCFFDYVMALDKLKQKYPQLTFFLEPDRPSGLFELTLDDLFEGLESIANSSKKLFADDIEVRECFEIVMGRQIQAK